MRVNSQSFTIRMTHNILIKGLIAGVRNQKKKKNYLFAGWKDQDA
jgi:hypothetical protein